MTSSHNLKLVVRPKSDNTITITFGRSIFCKYIHAHAQTVTKLELLDLRFSKLQFPGGRGGTPIYKLYGYVPHFRVWFLSCFSLK